MKNGKWTIGLLVSGIMDSFTESVSKGVMFEAKKRNVNLVVISCKYLDRDLSQNEEIMYEYQYNTMLSYASKENLDAVLVMADCIGCMTTKERIVEMLSQFNDMPCVLVASKIEGYINVSYDNYEGIKIGLEYLIQKLNCRKFCMLCGPDGNTDARERRDAFTSVLTENGIRLEERNFVEGGLSRQEKEIYDKLLDQNPDAEAIFCVNDDSALGLCDELKSRGRIPGEDIYIFGYDNTIPAAKSKPSLSSIWAASGDLGVQSLDLLLEILSGNTVSSRVLPTRFIKRDSFGTQVRSTGENKAEPIDEEQVDEYFNDIFYRLIGEEAGERIEIIYEVFASLMNAAAVLFDDGSLTEEHCADILDAVDEFCTGDALQYADVAKLTDNFTQLYHSLVSARPERAEEMKKYGLVETVIEKLISAVDAKSMAALELQISDSYSTKLFVRDSMQFETGNDESYAALLRRLDWLDIQNAYVYVFDEPVIRHESDPFYAPEYLNLKAVLKNGKAYGIPVTEQRTSFADIYRNNQIGADRYTMVLLPLFTNETFYGVLLCELTDKVFDNGEFLANQMSSAVKMIRLLNENEKIQHQLEKSLVIMRENNIMLDMLSKSDGLTGILNRRGFYTEAERFLEKCREDEKDVMVIYADMNHLKIINDRYGHEEGDYSIKLIADYLKEGIGERGIAGRIGGDEFACVLKCGPQEAQSIINGINERFENHNRHSSKPYNVTVSMGTFLSSGEETLSLNGMLSKADEKLYEAKSHRPKTVEKI